LKKDIKEKLPACGMGTARKVESTPPYRDLMLQHTSMIKLCLRWPSSTVFFGIVGSHHLYNLRKMSVWKQSIEDSSDTTLDLNIQAYMQSAHYGSN
jgi:hypothetical protein